MTEKRFIREEDSDYVEDTVSQTRALYIIDILNDLNHLSEENQAVKDILIKLKNSELFWDRDLLIDVVESIARVVGVDLE